MYVLVWYKATPPWIRRRVPSSSELLFRLSWPLLLLFGTPVLLIVYVTIAMDTPLTVIFIVQGSVAFGRRPMVVRQLVISWNQSRADSTHLYSTRSNSATSDPSVHRNGCILGSTLTSMWGEIRRMQTSLSGSSFGMAVFKYAQPMSIVAPWQLVAAASIRMMASPLVLAVGEDVSEREQ